MKKPYLKKNNEQGFSLIEFIVVLTIFSIMSGTSLFNFNKYQNNIEQTNIAQDIALTFRQAQVYGLSGSDRTVGSGALDDQGIADQVFDGDGNNSPIGNIVNIAQDKSIRGVAIITDPQQLIVFEDIDRSLTYEPNNDRVIDVRTILARDTLMSVCLIHEDDVPASPGDCSEEVRDDDVPVAVMFQRPYPDAYVEYEGEEDFKYVYIELYNNGYSEASRYVEISPIGNISVRSYEQ